MGHEPAVRRQQSAIDPRWHQAPAEGDTPALHRRPAEGASSHRLDEEHRGGVFADTCCGAPVFSSDARCDGASGWPGHSAPLDGAVAAPAGVSRSTVQTEVRCAATTVAGGAGPATDAKKRACAAS